ncbi:hypothetical protein TDB9533_04472 [Thalassocella blandensis]|nr:hypothetical protein TDB9533_04472 [Thalassocella blandensis]
MEISRYSTFVNTVTRKILPSIITCAASVSSQASAVEQPLPTLGFEVLSKTFQSGEMECEDSKFNYSRFRSAEAESAFLRQSFNAWSTEKNQTEEALSLLSSKLVEFETLREEKQQALAEANQILSEASLLTEEAKNAYKDCRDIFLREECQPEYEEYIAKRAAEREANTRVYDLKKEITDVDYEVEKITRDVAQATRVLDELESKLSMASQTLDYNLGIFHQFTHSYTSVGEVTTVNLYGDIAPFLDGKSLTDARAFYNMNVRQPASVGPALGALGPNDSYRLFKELSLSEYMLSWPYVELPATGTVKADIEQAFTELTHLRVKSDEQSSCALRNSTEEQSVLPRMDLVIDEVKTLPIAGTYLINVDIAAVLDGITSSANDFGYLSSQDLTELVETLPGFTIDQVLGHDQNEAVFVSKQLKQDLLYKLVSSVGIAVVNTQEAQCDSITSSPWCGVYNGWWLSTPDSDIAPSDIIARVESQFTLFTNQVDTHLFVTSPIHIETVLNAPKPVECEEGQEEVDGVCVDLPPECDEGQVLEDGVCVDIPPVCDEGQQLEDGVCVDIPPACDEGQQLEDGVCVDIPPACDEGQQFEDGVCVDISPVCDEDQQLENGICVDVPQECNADQILIDGVCQDDPCDFGEVYWSGICIPEDWL